MAKTKTKTDSKTKAKAKSTRTKKPAATDTLKELTKVFAGKRAFCEITWFRDKRKLAAKVFDWNTIDEAEKDDLVNDTFCDGIIEDLMEQAEEGNAFRAFAIPFAYLGAFPDAETLNEYAEDGGDWIVQPDGLLIYDTRDGSVHRVIIDGTAMVDDVKRVATSIEKLGIRALA